MRDFRLRFAIWRGASFGARFFLRMGPGRPYLQSQVPLEDFEQAASKGVAKRRPRCPILCHPQ